jgi:hypothetical protein
MRNVNKESDKEQLFVSGCVESGSLYASGELVVAQEISS